MLKKKLLSKRGFSLTELVVTMAIVSLLGVAVAAGISAAGRAYSGITMSSEAAVLSGTLAIELADELRFAENIKDNAGTVTFTSRRFGANASVASTDGRVTIGGKKILSDGAYTILAADADVSFSSGVFHVTITISKAGGEELGTWSFSVAPVSG